MVKSGTCIKGFCSHTGLLVLIPDCCCSSTHSTTTGDVIVIVAVVFPLSLSLSLLLSLFLLGTTWGSLILDLLYFGKTSPERQTSIPIYDRVPFLEISIPSMKSGWTDEQIISAFFSNFKWILSTMMSVANRTADNATEACQSMRALPASLPLPL